MSPAVIPSSSNRPTPPPSSTNTPSGTLITINQLSLNPRPNNTLRIIFQNCNGISPTRCELATLFSTANQLEPSLLGLAETNIDWNQHTKATTPFLRAIRSLWPHNKTITACADESHHSPTAYQPGGCAQITLNNLSPRHRNKSKDHTGMGRWTTQYFHGQRDHGLVIYTVYRVSQNSATGLGVKTAYLQQQRVLNRAGVIGAQPKEQVLIDLAPEITTNIENGNEVLVLMDANTAINDRDLTTFLATTSLYDLFHHDTLQLPTRWPGTKRIDFIFGTRHIANNVKALGYLPWDIPFTSDHIGLYVDLAESQIFGTNILDPAQPSQRRLRSTAPGRCDRYLRHLKKCVTANNLHQRMSDLYTKCLDHRHISARDRHKFQNIDKELTQYMLSAEKHCCHSQTKHRFSPILATNGKKVRILKSSIRQL